MMIVKICGITNFEDARVALEAGADLLGFNFYAKSPRTIAVEKVCEILNEIKDWRLESRASKRNLQSPISNSPKFVGLFVNETISRIEEILEQTGLDYAQLHGDETPEVVARLGNRGFRVIRPISFEDALQQAEAFQRTFPIANNDQSIADRPNLLIDAYDPSLFGGTGKKADWHAALEVARRYTNVMLAGGLTPENVGNAIALVQPWGVDVSSGVEVSPGKKDEAKVRAFVEAAKRWRGQ